MIHRRNALAWQSHFTGLVLNPAMLKLFFRSSIELRKGCVRVLIFDPEMSRSMCDDRGKGNSNAGGSDERDVFFKLTLKNLFLNPAKLPEDILCSMYPYSPRWVSLG
uniref:(northern house mosquito) hypothetical protein n=1 Tax=Culex pipiens TaxID=7175 RepID=A0A8D8HBG4_CULPI